MPAYLKRNHYPSEQHLVNLLLWKVHVYTGNLVNSPCPSNILEAPLLSPSYVVLFYLYILKIMQLGWPVPGLEAKGMQYDCPAHFQLLCDFFRIWVIS